MITFLLVTFIIVLLVALGVCSFYLVRFARIIFSIEDKLENALETLNQTHGSLDSLLEMRLFFDSKEVKFAVDEALISVKLSRTAIVTLINDFTNLSKEKYITLRSDEEDSEEQDPQQQQQDQESGRREIARRTQRGGGSLFSTER